MSKSVSSLDGQPNMSFENFTNPQDGETALFKASRGGHLPVAQLLIDRGADFNVSHLIPVFV